MSNFFKNPKRVLANVFSGGGNGPDLGYKAYVASITQSGTDAPVATVLQSNLLQGTPVWSRTAAGIYKLTLTGAFLEAKTSLPFGVTVGATATVAQVIYGATGIEGYIYFNRESDNVLRLQTNNALNVPTEISTLIGTGIIMLPEVRVYP